MFDINRANRNVCDLEILHLKTKEPFLTFDTANTTTAGISSENTYANAKGTHRVTFTNPLSGTISVSAQVYPLRIFALYSDGTIETTGQYADTQEVSCTTEGELTLNVPKNGTIVAGTVFVYPADAYADESSLIKGTFATTEGSSKFTASTDDKKKIEANKKYKVGYIVSRTGVKKVSFNNKKLAKDYFITMKTLDKDEEGTWTPLRINAYKATVQRNFELSFSSEGDPAEITVTFDLNEDKDGNFLDMIEIPDDEI